MNKPMKKRDHENKLPKFSGRTLGADELCRVTGGREPESGSTWSICHIDGIDDGDGGGGVA